MRYSWLHWFRVTLCLVFYLQFLHVVLVLDELCACMSLGAFRACVRPGCIQGDLGTGRFGGSSFRLLYLRIHTWADSFRRAGGSMHLFTIFGYFCPFMRPSLVFYP